MEDTKQPNQVQPEQTQPDQPMQPTQPEQLTQSDAVQPDQSNRLTQPNQPMLTKTQAMQDLLRLIFDRIDLVYNLVVFGGYVRDVIVPMLCQGLDPLGDLCPAEYTANDLDILVDHIDSVFLQLKSVIPSLVYDENQIDRSVYGLNVKKITIQHLSYEIKLDLVEQKRSIPLDFSCNAMTFSNQSGLSYITTYGNIESLDRRISTPEHVGQVETKKFQVIQQIQKKQFTCYWPIFSSDYSRERTFILLRRFFKMYSLGWTCDNLFDSVRIDTRTIQFTDNPYYMRPDNRSILSTVPDRVFTFEEFIEYVEGVYSNAYKNFKYYLLQQDQPEILYENYLGHGIHPICRELKKHTRYYSQYVSGQFRAGIPKSRK